MTRSGFHSCPIDGCAAEVPDHLLMCLAHWRRVPRALAAEINDAWKRVSAGEPEALLGYRMARDAAIAAVNDKIRAGR